MCMRADIDWESGKCSNFREPVFDDEFQDEVLNCKNKDLQVDYAQRGWHEVMKPDEKDELALVASSSSAENERIKTFGSMDYLSDSMARLFVTGKYEHTLSSGPVQARSASLGMYHFMPQLEDSADVKAAKQHDDTVRAEDEFEQHDTFRTKKRVHAETLGSITTFGDATKTVVNATALSFVAEKHADMAAPVPADQSVFFQVFDRFGDIYSSGAFISWANKRAPEQPQLPHQMIRWPEEAFISLARCTMSKAVISAIEKETLDTFTKSSLYDAAVCAFKAMHEVITAHIRSESKLTIVPPTCPDAANPEKLAIKKLKRDLEAQVAATAAAVASANKKSANKTPKGNTANDSASGGGGGRGRGPPSRQAPQPGRGGGAPGRGGGGPGRGRGNVVAAVPKDLGSFFTLPNFNVSFPDTTTKKYCVGWMCVGRECTRGYNQCEGKHYRFDQIPVAGDKKILADYVASTDSMWFNERDVRSLTEDSHKAKLGDSSGYGTTN